MSITDMIVSAILKKGILYEAHNVNLEFNIPREQATSIPYSDGAITIRFKADNMSLKIDKSDKD